MRICAHCAAQNRVGLLFCEECGHPLHQMRDTTPSVRLEPAFYEDLADTLWSPTTQYQIVTLHVRTADAPIVLRPVRQVIIGRVSTDGLNKPDVDLTPYGAQAAGLSRRHASIRRYKDKLVLVDLDSPNGTFINHERCAPGVEYVLHDGDELQFGQLIAYIYLK